MPSSLLSGTGFAILGALALVSCSGGGGGRSPTPTTPTPVPSTVTVSIVGSIGNSAYKPNPVAASPGDTVIFRNNDAAMHHIVMDDGSADLGAVMPGATSRGLVLSNMGAARFHCSVHPSMVGAINAATAPEPKPCPDPYGYGC